MKRAKKIIDNVYWVGVRDLNNRHFHGDLYPIDEGCTYNAYLVVDDEVTLFDTVEEEFTEELLERVESVLQGREIDNIVVQHTEPDHSGGFKKVYAKYPNAKVYAQISLENLKYFRYSVTRGQLTFRGAYDRIRLSSTTEYRQWKPIGKRRKSTEGVKLSGVRRADRTMGGCGSGESRLTGYRR